MHYDKSSNKHVFLQGLVKGLAAPAVLFQAPELPSIPHLEVFAASNGPIETTLAGDWRRIGMDFETVIHRYKKTNSNK